MRTLEETPSDATHWSTRDLAKQVGMSPSSIGRIWQAFGLKPWLTDTFKLSEDPQFIDKVRDVVGLYMNPPEHAVVLCVDEKTGIQALNRTKPALPMRPGQVERRTHDYVRNGVVDLFAALNIATGHVLARIDKQHRAVEFIKFLDAIDANVPAGLDVHVVMDNASTHKTPAVHTWLLRHPRFTFHFTPTSSSWLNLVERWFGHLTDKKLRRSAHNSVRNSPPTLKTGRIPGTTTRNRSSGPRPPIKSSTNSSATSQIYNKLLTQDTSGHADKYSGECAIPNSPCGSTSGHFTANAKHRRTYEHDH